MRRIRTAVLMAMITVAGCTSVAPRGGGYYADDGPDRVPRDVVNVPDAVPRPEPFSRSGNKPYKVLGRMYYPLSTQKGYRERGIASWYGKKFHGRSTSSGERYDMYAMTAAHKTLPIPCYARVTNLRNGRSVIVRVNDRGPFLHNRLIDLSYAAAGRLGITTAGTGLVQVEAIDPGQPTPTQVAKRSPTSDPKIYVQLGAFSERARAERERARLQGAGLQPFIATHKRLLSVVYRLRIGPLGSVDESDNIVSRAARHGVPDAHVVIE